MIGRVAAVGVAMVCLVVIGLAPAVQAQVLEPLRVELLPGNPYYPPPCTGIFADVPCPGGFAVDWIEKYYADNITGGCATNPLRYCPDAPVTRAQMAVFVESAMRGTDAWSPGDLGSSNTGLGAGSLLNNSPYAQSNTAIGYFALSTQSYANGNSWFYTDNTAVGYLALFDNQPDGGNGNANGTRNTAVGVDALTYNTVGYQNTAVGFSAGYGNISGQRNTFLGYNADAEHSDLFNATAIGYLAIVDSSNKVRIGNSAVAVIEGQVAWSWPSDVRMKENIRDLDLGLDFVMALRPVSFTMKQGNGRTDMGFLAQDVEALLGDGYNVVAIGADAERTRSLRGTDLIAPLVKAIQDQQAEIQALKAQLAEQARQIGVLLANHGAGGETAPGDN